MNSSIVWLVLESMPSLYEVCVWATFPEGVNLGTDGSPNVYFTTDCIYNNDSIVFIPDTAFLYALIEEGVDTNGDSLISYEEAEAVTSLRVIEKGISNMTGIEAFVNLQVLHCSYNEIKTLDISNLASLTELWCASNQLASLDVTHNSALERIYCPENEIAILDISNNTSLQRLNCTHNKLTSLDCLNNTILEVLDCQGNMITSLKYNSPALETLWCGNNKISSLDISNNRALKHLSCGWNLLTSLDVSNNVELEYFDCPCNNITEIDISNNSALISLDVGNYWFTSGNNQISSLDVSDNPMLRDLICNFNQLTSLDVTYNTALTGLDCSGNQLTTLDISKNRALGTGIYGINGLYLHDMPLLNEVCVWTDTFPPTYLGIDTARSPNVNFTSECSGSTELLKYEQKEFSIYPNPTNHQLTIETSQPDQHFIEITSLNGQLLHTEKIEGPTHQIDLSSFQKGLYIITIRSRDYVWTEKIIKQ
jgi:Leucine-rich repeat (LRR) protein